MSQGNVGPDRFVPSGVDAQSWIGFEHRIQERRFKALVATITSAIAQRDGVAARAALEEARELRPGSPEVERLAARVAVLPIGAATASPSAYMWYRGLGAVSMFAVGIGLVIGIESLRPGTSESAPAAELAVHQPRTEVAGSRPVVIDDSGKPTSPPPAVAPDTPIAAERTSVAVPVQVEVKREEPVGTAGELRASKVDAAPAGVPNRTTFRAPGVTSEVADGRSERESAVQARREVPDDYVAPSPRSENRPGYVEVTTPGAALAANVMPQPVSIIAPPPVPPVLPATAATVTAPAVAPRSDQGRVKQVLNQYARAYGELDSTAARAVWPTVDERALARAFASLESQDVTFDQCDIDVKGALASASCRGTASYVGKIGSRQARTEARQWNFELKLHGDDWKIEKAQTAVAR